MIGPQAVSSSPHNHKIDATHFQVSYVDKIRSRKKKKRRKERTYFAYISSIYFHFPRLDQLPLQILLKR